MSDHPPLVSAPIVKRVAGHPIQRIRRNFDFFRRLFDHWAIRYLTRRAQAHLADGKPPMAAFSFDYIGRMLAVEGRFEADDLAVLAEFLAPLAAKFARSTALDIGANIGNHALFFSPMFQQVHCFEPSPRTFGVLSVNTALANNITPHNLALGESKAKMSLSYSPLNVGEASLVQSANQAGLLCHEVEVVRLDEFGAEFEDVAFLKIDVEGFEPEVLRGAQSLLARFKPVIAFEQNASAFVDGASPTVNLLVEAGYHICVMTKRDVVGGVLGRPFALLKRLLNGLEYDILEVDCLPPGQYSMLIALSSEDFAAVNQGRNLTA